MDLGISRDCRTMTTGDVMVGRGGEGWRGWSEGDRGMSRRAVEGERRDP